MDWKTLLIRFAGFVVIAVFGGLMFAVTANILILLNLMPSELNGQGYGYVLASKSSYVWMGTIVIGFISIFIKDSWRYVLYFSPLYGPSIFAVVYTLLHR